MWNAIDGTIRSKYSRGCLTSPLELEAQADPLSIGSQAVVSLNQAGSGSEEITV